MNSFDGYVLERELYLKAKVPSSLIRGINNVDIEKMGNTAIVKKDSLPSKYRKIAEDCEDLGNYLTMTFLNELLGCGPSYLFVYENHFKRKLEGITIGKTRLIFISKEFKILWNKGKVPFLIKPDNKEYADEIIQMQGLKIGFY